MIEKHIKNAYDDVRRLLVEDVYFVFLAEVSNYKQGMLDYTIK